MNRDKPHHGAIKDGQDIRMKQIMAWIKTSFLAISTLAMLAGSPMAQNLSLPTDQFDAPAHVGPDSVFQSLTGTTSDLTPATAPYAPLNSNTSSRVELRPVLLEAKLAADDSTLQDGLVWRVFHPVPGQDGKLPLLAISEGGSARFEFQPGDYLMHVSFGRAGASKRLSIPASGPIDSQTIVLDAGGLILNAVSGTDLPVPAEDLRFSIFSDVLANVNDRNLITDNVKAGTLVALNSGTYHIVSNYGHVNASVRADIRIEAGKLTEATLQHRAARLTLKLVAEEGGEAIADTAWSIINAAGDIISESVGAFPSLVLAEGEYTALARHKERLYQRDFTVVAGLNQDVEVLLNE